MNAIHTGVAFFFLIVCPPTPLKGGLFSGLKNLSLKWHRTIPPLGGWTRSGQGANPFQFFPDYLSPDRISLFRKMQFVFPE